MIRFLLVLLLGIAAALLTAYARARPGHPATLRCGYAEFRPYTSIDEQGGPAGLAVDIVRRAAERAGVRIEWVRTDDPEAALRRREIDLVPLFTVTAARERECRGRCQADGIAGPRDLQKSSCVLPKTTRLPRLRAPQ